MVHALLKAQSLVLAAGTAFSWYTLVGDFQRYFDAGGGLLETSGCAVTHPVLTPCFYGAIAFAAAFVWSLALLRSAPDRIVPNQKGLNALLVVATVFAWAVFGYEMFAVAMHRPAPKFSCPALSQAPVQPLDQPCFYGGLMFLAALVISLLILRNHGTQRHDMRTAHATHGR